MSILFIIAVIVGTIASAIIYRLGGCSKEAWLKEYPWIPIALRKIPKIRSVFCNLIVIVLASTMIVAPFWIWVLCYALCFLTLLSYHDTAPWNWMKPEDNYWLHGLVNGLALLPLVFVSPVLIWFVLARALIMGLFMGVWCYMIWSIDYIEEWGRGAILVASLLLLLI